MSMRRAGLWFGLVLLTACGTAPSQPGGSDVAAPGSSDRVVQDARSPVVEGSRVRSSGYVVSVPERPARLCAPVATEDIGYPPGQEPAPQYCEHGVDLEGVELDALAHRREKDGAVAGSAVLTGVWRRGAFHVETQELPPSAPAPDADGFGPHVAQTPPCPAPAGGWPSTFKGDNIDEAEPAMNAFRAEHPESMHFMAFLRPAPEQVVLGVAVQDETARADAERLLRPVLGERLCITKARYTPEQVKQVQEHPALKPGPAPHPIFSSGTGVSDDLQPVHRLGVVMITEELLAVAAEHPDGLVEFEPTVVVMGASAVLPTASPTEKLPAKPSTEAHRPEPGSLVASEPTRYWVGYDSEAAYDEHVDAVQACLELPGTSEVFQRQRRPPIEDLTVTGVRENRAFQGCLSGLRGVTVRALIPYDESAAPKEFVDRSRLASCGEHVVGHGPTPRSAVDCFADALGSAAGAEYAVARLSEEGETSVIYYRALPGQATVEVWLDTTRDTFGHQRWLQDTCTGYDRGTGQATGCAPNGTGRI